MRQVTASQLDEMLRAEPQQRPIVIDVREPWEWQLARISGSTHLPMGEIPSRIQEIDPTHPTVVICHHGVRSLQVVAYLQRQGFDNLHNLMGGIDAWSRNVDPSVPLY
jgi:rhodanese-related sulfurtransferase